MGFSVAMWHKTLFYHWDHQEMCVQYKTSQISFVMLFWGKGAEYHWAKSLPGCGGGNDLVDAGRPILAWPGGGAGRGLGADHVRLIRHGETKLTCGTMARSLTWDDRALTEQPASRIDWPLSSNQNVTYHLLKRTVWSISFWFRTKHWFALPSLWRRVIPPVESGGCMFFLLKNLVWILVGVLYQTDKKERKENKKTWEGACWNKRQKHIHNGNSEKKMK